MLESLSRGRQAVLLFAGLTAVTLSACDRTGAAVAPIGGGAKPSAAASASAEPASPSPTPSSGNSAAPTPTATPSASASPSPSARASATPAATPTPTPSALPTPVASATASPKPTPDPFFETSVWGIGADSDANCTASNTQCIIDFPDSALRAGNGSGSSFLVARPGENLRAATFDAAGDLWITEYPEATANGQPQNGDIAEFKPATLNGTYFNTAATPDVVVPVNGWPQGITFDAGGNLWVVVSSPVGAYVPNIERYSGSPSASSSPVVTLAGGNGGFVFSGIGFDANGTLWCSVALSYGPNPAGLYGFTSSQIAASGSPAATYTLAGPASGAAAAGQAAIAAAVRAVAFDPSGNLWSSDFGTVYEYAQSQLSASQTTPALAFVAYATGTSGNNTVFEIPTALAFDANAELYTANGAFGFELYTKSAYSASSPVPTTSISESYGNAPSFMAAGPTAPFPIPTATPTPTAMQRARR